MGKAKSISYVFSPQLLGLVIFLPVPHATARLHSLQAIGFMDVTFRSSPFMWTMVIFVGWGEVSSTIMDVKIEKQQAKSFLPQCGLALQARAVLQNDNQCPGPSDREVRAVSGSG